MMDPTLLSKSELVELVKAKDAALEARQAELASHQAELQSHQDALESQRQQLRDQDISLQTKELKIQELAQERDGWKLAYDKLWQERFRRRSERYIENPDQMRLDFGDTDAAADAALGLADAVEDQEQTVAQHKRRKPRSKRDGSFPAHLQRYEVMAEVPDEQKHCLTHGERTPLPESMWDTTETLEYEPPKAKVRVTKYPKYVCDNEPACGVVSPERPTSLVEGNKYDTSVAVEIITGKYGYHLPLYRLQDYFAGAGWTPSRSTQYNILSRAHFVLEPLLEYFKEQVQSDPVVGTDETRVTLLLPKVIPKLDLDNPKERRAHEVFTEAINRNRPSITGRMWAYRGTEVKLNVFDFTVSRHRDGPELFFKDYSGTLLGDCWKGFESIVAASDGRIVRSACNYHARRKFEHSSAYPDERERWMRWYQQLSDIEDRGRDLSPAERLALRQSEAAPIWDEIATWLEDIEHRTSNVILPKSDLGKAVQYVRNHWTELRRYLDDGRIPFDNNETEQLMKQVALGRKNWLFAGSLAGGERSAGFLTLVSSALRNDLDVWIYVKDVLDRLLAGQTDYEPLLPWNWAQEHPDGIRQYRVEERNDRTDRKRRRRAARRRKAKR